MKYMLLLVGTSETMSYDLSPEDSEAEMAAHGAFTKLIEQRGGVNASEALFGPEQARTLRKSDDGSIAVTDGPYAELKEYIGGFYVFEATDMDEAVELAKQCPLYSASEIRPVVDFSQM